MINKNSLLFFHSVNGLLHSLILLSAIISIGRSSVVHSSQQISPSPDQVPFHILLEQNEKVPPECAERTGFLLQHDWLTLQIHDATPSYALQYVIQDLLTWNIAGYVSLLQTNQTRAVANHQVSQLHYQTLLQGNKVFRQFPPLTQPVQYVHSEKCI